jgi:hypothetical protein
MLGTGARDEAKASLETQMVWIKPEIIAIAEAPNHGIHKGQISLFLGEVGKFMLQGTDHVHPFGSGGSTKLLFGLFLRYLSIYRHRHQVNGLACFCGHVIHFLGLAVCISAAAIVCYYLVFPLLNICCISGKLNY